MPEPEARLDTLDLSPTQLRIVREILARHADGLTVWVFGARARWCQTLLRSRPGADH